MTPSTRGRAVRDDRELLGAQRFSAWWQRVPADIDRTYVSRGKERRRFSAVDPTDIDGIAMNRRTKEVLIVEFKANVQQFLGNIGQSNALRRIAQLPGVRARVIGEPTGFPKESYAAGDELPFGTVERSPRYGSITVDQLAAQFTALQDATDDAGQAALTPCTGKGLEVIGSWWPDSAPATAAPHHLGAVFQVGFGNAASHLLVIEFVEPGGKAAPGKADLLDHLATLPNVTVALAEDPHFGEPVGKGDSFDRGEPMPFTVKAGNAERAHEATVGEFTSWIHHWLLRADQAR